MPPTALHAAASRIPAASSAPSSASESPKVRSMSMAAASSRGGVSRSLSSGVWAEEPAVAEWRAGHVRSVETAASRLLVTPPTRRAVAVRGPGVHDPQLMRRYDGEIAIVTGAASGIGNRLALDLVERGARVFGLDRQAELLEGVTGVSPVVCDLSDTDAFRHVLADVEHEVGRIDLLANIAGIDEPIAAVGADLAFYRRIIEVNFFAAAEGTLAVLPGMTQRGHGYVVNCSSDSVRTPIAHESAYVASKGALSAFTESVALEVVERGVHVHVLYPGFVETPLAVKSLDRGMKRPPKAVRRTTEQVSRAVLERLGGKAIEIDAARVAAMTPLVRTLAPPLYRRMMAGRTMPL
jgi:2-hydroxycyclohexanecarboxyl-CoA dehydrogenase